MLINREFGRGFRVLDKMVNSLVLVREILSKIRLSRVYIFGFRNYEMVVCVV